MKINFKKLLVAKDIAHKQCENKDYREEFANILHKNGDGVAASCLAFKIYQSSGEVEYTDEEVNLIRSYANSYCKAFFIDALNHAIGCQAEVLTDKQQ